MRLEFPPFALERGLVFSTLLALQQFSLNLDQAVQSEFAEGVYLIVLLLARSFKVRRFCYATKNLMVCISREPPSMGLVSYEIMASILL